mmetsp:Transcript_8152/g.26249  ORF Transcript_8152/g.26249 Transcript_8152/m.26249 type:complete len:312 (+) Transcript_8152:1364-2299(+)|eukprot:scaffold25308_cov124-Isochrysis_galbana.AAC.2
MVLRHWKKTILRSICRCCDERAWCESNARDSAGVSAKMSTLEAMMSGVVQSVVSTPTECRVANWLASTMSIVDRHETRSRSRVVRSRRPNATAGDVGRLSQMMSEGSGARHTSSLNVSFQYMWRKSTLCPPPSPTAAECRRMAPKWRVQRAAAAAVEKTTKAWPVHGEGSAAAARRRDPHRSRERSVASIRRSSVRLACRAEAASMDRRRLEPGRAGRRAASALAYSAWRWRHSRLRPRSSSSPATTRRSSRDSATDATGPKKRKCARTDAGVAPVSGSPTTCTAKSEARAPELDSMLASARRWRRKTYSA